MLRMMYCGMDQETVTNKNCGKTISVNINPEDETDFKKSLWFCCYEHMIERVMEDGYELH